MDCILDILDSFIPGTTEGGQWELIGYSQTVNGPFGAGGNWPWANNGNDHVNVDFSNIQQGYYRLNYFLPGDCGGQVGVTVPVVGGGDAGTTAAVTICQTDSPLNIAQQLGTIYDQGVLQAAFSITGSGTGSGSYNAGNANTPSDNTFDPSTSGVGNFEFIVAITPQSPIGFSLDSCDQCQPSTATLLVSVVEPAIAISMTDCWIYLDSVTGCEGGQLQLQRNTGGGWVGIVGATLPYQADQNADYRVQGVNCDCLAVFSNIVTAAGCCVDSPPLVIEQAVGNDCFLLRSSGTPCVGGTYQWYKSCDSGQSWQLAPYGDTDQVVTNDDCWYQLVRSCPSGCEQRSNILQVSGCAASCNGVLVASANGCTLEVTGGVACGGTGTFTLQRNTGGGSYVNVSSAAYSGYPQSFTITTNGTYRVVLNCDNDGCPLYESNEVVFNSCESVSCDSELTVTVNDCTITANVTNCPNPFFVFKRFNNQVQSGSQNFYNALVNGTHTVEVYNCPNCSVLLGSAEVVTCNTGCSSGISAVVNGCTITASVTNCSNPTYVFKDGTTTLQSGSSNVYVHPTEENVTITVQAIGCPGCSTIETFVSIDCVNCACSTEVTESSCQLFAVDSNCGGYSGVWRYFNTGLSAWVVKGSGSNIVPDENGLWERRLTKAGCSDVFDQIDVSCITCTLQITSAQIDPANCNQILFTYSGAVSNNITILLNSNLVGTNCGNAGGWSSFSPGAGSSFNFLPNGNGSGTIVIPSSLAERCIRIIIIDNDQGGCPAAEERVFFPRCCDATPTIQITGCAPYTATVINAPAGSTYLWSDGSTGSSIQLYNGAFSVTITDSTCEYTLNSSVSCCSDPCLTNFESCVHYNWLAALSQPTASTTYITKFAVNGSNLIGSPQLIQWSPSVFVPGSGNSIIFNPSLVNTLNFLSNNLIAFDLADNTDYNNCLNAIPNRGFLGLMRIIKSTCVTSFEIIVDLANVSPVFGQGLYRYTQNGLEFFSNGSWVDIITVLGTDYMPNNGPCDCELIDLCA